MEDCTQRLLWAAARCSHLIARDAGKCGLPARVKVFTEAQCLWSDTWWHAHTFSATHSCIHMCAHELRARLRHRPITRSHRLTHMQVYLLTR